MNPEELTEEIAGLVVQGNNLKADFSEAVTSMSVDLPVNAIPEIKLEVEDPDLKLWSRGLFVAGTPATAAPTLNADGSVKIIAGTPGSPVRWRDTVWEVTEVEVGTGAALGGFTVKLTPDVFARMSRAAGEAAWDEVSVSQWLTDRVRAAGGTIVAQASPAPQAQIAREGGNDPESDLDVADRLASAEKRVIMWSLGTTYYGAPSWLADRLPNKKLTWPSGGDLELLDMPRCRRSAADKTKAASITATVHRRHATDLLALPSVDAAGIAQFRGRYLMTKLSWKPGVPEGLSLELSTPVDPRPDLSDDPGGTIFGIGVPAYATSLPTGGQTVKVFMQLALHQAGDHYKLGTGRNLGDPDPDMFDCSGLVYWCCGQLGISIPASAEGIFNRCSKDNLLLSVDEALTTPGALLFIIHPGANKPGVYDHVAISIGDGRTIEARGSRYGVNIFEGAARRSWTNAAFVPGIAYR